MMNYLLVAAGSAVGGMARYGAGSLAGHVLGDSYPWGTLAVNVLGSLAIGVLAVLLPLDGRWDLTQEARALLMIGVCGGFTTFSSFSIETLNVARNGEWIAALSYVVGSVLLCLAAVALGYFGTLALQR